MKGKNLRGFWKPQPGDVSSRIAELNHVRKKRGKSKPKNPHKVPDDRFMVSLEWRQIRYLTLKNCDGRCMCCGASAADGARLHVDHIKPRKTHPQLALNVTNVQVLCDDCNIGKGGWDDTDWRPHMRAMK